MQMVKEIYKRVRNLIIRLYPETIEIDNKKYIRIVRISNQGFNIKPYKSNDFCHAGDFMDILISDTSEFDIKLDEQKVTKADFNHVLMKGCHCFFYKFDIKQVDKRGSLFFRTYDKANIMYLPEDEIIWVNNVNPSLHKIVNEITCDIPNPETGIKHTFISRYGDDIDWVKMPLNIAVLRTEEHSRTNKRIRECISQMYLTESQIKDLKKISLIKLKILEVKNRVKNAMN